MKTVRFMLLMFLVVLSISFNGCGGGGDDKNGGGTTGTAPSAPTGVSATAGNGKVTVNWAAVSGATTYNLYMATQSGVTKSNYASLAGGMTHATVTSPYAHTELTNGTAYYFIVTAVNGSGESEESTEASVTPTIVSQFDGIYTGSWSRLCPTCGTPPPDNQNNSGVFTVTVANGVFTNIYISPPAPGAGGPRFDSGTVSSSGTITGIGATPSQCSSSVSMFTGQITISSGSASMTMTYSRTASPEGCAAESGTITATRP